MKPRTITVTTWLMVIFTALPWFLFAFRGELHPDLVLLIIYTAVAGKVIHSYWSGERWARHLVLISSILSVADVGRSTDHDLVLRVSRLGVAALSLFLLFWLNGKEGRTYFRALYREEPQVSDPNSSTV